MPKFCNPLTVAENKGKLRLVIDLRNINDHVVKHKFQYEDLHTLSETMNKNDFFTTFDLKTGYYHIDIHPEQQKFLGFQWTFKDNSTRYFQFVVLPMGLSTACYVFTKVLRPFVSKWRGQGIKAIIYLDDGILSGKSQEETSEASDIARRDIENSGLVLNLEKSDFNPRQEGQWLGTVINTKVMKFFVPKNKVKSLLQRINTALSQALVCAKQLSYIAGHLSSMHAAIGPSTRMFTRGIYRDIESRISWYNFFEPSTDTKSELKFWSKNLKNHDGYSMKHSPAHTKVIFSDASDSGFGGFVCEKLNRKVCAGSFSSLESSSSSTYRELLTIKYVLQSFSRFLTGETIQINTDNQNASRILTIGSTKTDLHQLSLDIFHLTTKNDIILSPKWIPREENELADYLTHVNDSDNWSVNHSCFQFISRHFGPFTIDRFADNNNSKLKRFNSKFYCPGTENVNAFTEDWSKDNNWLCPPISLVGSTIKHLKLCKASGTLLVPVWRSAYFWPILFPNGIQMASFIKDFKIVKPFFISNKSNIFHGYTRFDCIALKVSFS